MSGAGDCACKTLGPLGRVGPLGADNSRQQLGRSFKLQIGNSPTVIGEVPLNRDSLLVYTGSGVEDEDTGKAAGDAYASALSITCHLDMIDTEESPQPQPGNILGEIEWGTDGTSAKAEFDWKHGTVIQVSGSFVKLRAFLESVPGLDPDEVVVRQTVGGHIGYYPVTKCAPTRTLFVGGIADAGESDPLRIPRFACKTFFLGVPAVASNDVVIRYRAQPASAPIAEGQGALASSLGFLIPNGAHYVTVTNDSGDPIVDSRLIFELAL